VAVLEPTGGPGWPAAATGPWPRRGGDRGPADRTAPPGRGARRRRDPPEPAAARAGQPDAAHRPPADPHLGTNRQVAVFGAIEVSTGRWVYRLGRRCAADFMALLDQVLRAFPRSPVIAVICDNDSIHHARKVTAYLVAHPRLELLYAARYSPHDNPAERIWAALTNYLPILPFPGRSGSGRSTPSSASAHPARCWPPPRPGPAPGYRPVTSRTSGMPP